MIFSALNALNGNVVDWTINTELSVLDCTHYHQRLGKPRTDGKDSNRVLVVLTPTNCGVSAGTVIEIRSYDGIAS